MPCHLHILDADGRLSAWRPRIRAAFDASAAQVASRIPVGDVDVVVYDDAEYVVPELGMSGFCTSPRRMYLPMDVAHPGLDASFETVFQAFLAHELHHCARRRIDGFADTLAQALVSEGLACAFEAELPGGTVPMYARALQGPALEAFRARAAGAMHQPLSSWGDWFFGEGPADIPRHAGYALGHAIVQAWLQGNGQTAAAAWDVPADRFITEAP